MKSSAVVVSLVLGAFVAGVGAFSSPAPPSPSPVLVLGSTGKVGRLVVENLVAQKIPVRAFARNRTKASEVLSSPTGMGGLNPWEGVEVVVGDLTSEADLSAALEGVSDVIAVSGALRFSKLSDFLPWRLLGNDPMGWCSDKTHPYFVNYLSMVTLAKVLSAKRSQQSDEDGEVQVPKIVRLTGLSVGLPGTNPVSLIFNTLLSLTGKWHARGERVLRQSGLDYTILRPGGLADGARPPGVAVQVVAVNSDGTSVPPPARLGREDLASLAVQCLGGGRRATARTTLACRWVGATQPKAQGAVGDGSAEWGGELAKLDAAAMAVVERDMANAPLPRKAGGVALLVYPALALGCKIALGLVAALLARLGVLPA